MSSYTPTDRRLSDSERATVRRLPTIRIAEVSPAIDDRRYSAWRDPHRVDFARYVWHVARIGTTPATKRTLPPPMVAPHRAVLDFITAGLRSLLSWAGRLRTPTRLFLSARRRYCGFWVRCYTVLIRDRRRRYRAETDPYRRWLLAREIVRWSVARERWCRALRGIAGRQP